MVSRKAPATRSRNPSRTTPPANGRPRRDPTSARERIAALRVEACEQARPLVAAGAAPIRVMARMVADLETRCREEGIPEEIARRDIVNRTIGDVDVRRISARLDGPEYVSLADDMGLALPGEEIDGIPATGERYRWIHQCMEDFERQLLACHVDMRVYDLAGVGNPQLREMLSEHLQARWEYTVPPSQLYLSLGSLDGLGKFFQGFTALERQQHNGAVDAAVLFPAPGFNVPEWQAKTLGLRLHRVVTRADDGFKLTAKQLRAALREAPDIRVVYLIVSNNPTAFAYTPAELRALCDVLREADHDVLLAADLAYIGTADPAEDYARMAVFNEPGVLEHCALFFSFSKTHTLTGDRCGYVAFGNQKLATDLGPGWTNTTASLPAEWQLRYMANVRLFTEHPEIEQRIRALYRHRRGQLVRQLLRLNEQHHIFATINLDDGGTVYNWSQLAPGEDVFSLFAKTGIAGVPGGAFGYTDDYIRLSVGCIPVPEE